MKVKIQTMLGDIVVRLYDGRGNDSWYCYWTC